jgi:hypothetical protein
LHANLSAAQQHGFAALDKKPFERSLGTTNYIGPCFLSYSWSLLALTVLLLLCMQVCWARS